jgi:N6-adenosine-specific RNA methylase IME4
MSPGEVMGKLRRVQSTLPAHLLKDRVVQRLLEAEKALGQALGVDQVKLVMDAAAAQEVFAKRQRLGEDVIGYAHTIKTRALGRLGELLEKLDKAKGARLAGRSPGSNSGVGGTKMEPPTAAATYADLGISKKIAAVAQQLAALPLETREAIAQRETTIAKVRRERKAADIRKAVSLPDAKYRVLYADPPWHYRDKADEGAVQAGGAARHYPTMTIAQLCELPVETLCEAHAVLFLWVTSPLLFEAAAVLRAWGFTYKASFIWDKVKHNMGHYNSVRHELLLVCTRGSCTPDHVELFDSVQSVERTTHSTKPPEFRHIIETLYPHGKRLELFARAKAPGWDVFGYEVTAAVGA